MPDLRTIHIISTSRASDRGFRALADLATAAGQFDECAYRVVGGHMVQLLQHVYPIPNWQLRGTADADAGMDQGTLVAIEPDLRRRIEELGYTLAAGNRYTREVADGPLDIDILVPSFGASRQDTEVAGRGFDGVPGLSLAVNAAPVVVDAHATLTTGEQIEFAVPIPDVEIAVVLKALAWRSRAADKDVTDLVTLFQIVHRHRDKLTGWRLDQASLIGARHDAVKALRVLADRVDEGGWKKAFPPTASPAHFSALIRRYAHAMT
ncbi:hypothetical protein IU438_13490 [Nocardia cyriacigeorgica]|uniref:hypothetical protein n=1 Tax=Nocardia cyriacigeorgica TaxID=135487 RepID=UPI001894E2F8|nr:hypothetical protein [Nocardia cyriacigeorgica]MBF6086123.1 hypothetical protein [Nocardia cyriacigeorgica]MBF6092213.1 hypothetical protein [Nocardia cyriacigeorgica]MBF6396807.1 hypothetical protein [Nocardia cyriacigeorgica]MBF6403535.1 hypothetical protein [Nocardia cyriacigeorgica]